jgi:muramidase (phage lysozyme)
MEGNRKAFLDMIADSELGQALLAVSDNGYNVLAGSTAEKPILFESYADHPHRVIKIERKNLPPEYSSAAGRYQIMGKIFDAYKKILNLQPPYFSPPNQNMITLQLIKECHALGAIDKGDIITAITECEHRWASFPGAGYKDQHENKMEQLIAAFQKAGGILIS